MNTLFTISYWIALVTVIPGFITIAAVFGALAFVSLPGTGVIAAQLASMNDWIVVAIAITLMILTQAVGILLEELLVTKRLLGRKPIKPHGIRRYEEFSNLYFLLARMRSDDDAHGHLRRTVAQFFLTLNSMVSFSAGILTGWIVAVIPVVGVSPPGGPGGLWGQAVMYTLIMLLCLAVCYPVAVIRFREMARVIWAVRAVNDAGQEESSSGNPDE